MWCIRFCRLEVASGGKAVVQLSQPRLDLESLALLLSIPTASGRFLSSEVRPEVWHAFYPVLNSRACLLSYNSFSSFEKYKSGQTEYHSSGALPCTFRLRVPARRLTRVDGMTCFVWSTTYLFVLNDRFADHNVPFRISESYLFWSILSSFNLSHPALAAFYSHFT